MRITSDFPLRTRRAILAAGGAALVRCATLGAVSPGVASAQSSATPPPMLSSTGNAVFVTSDSADLKQRQSKFVATLAGKLGVSSDKLQQALDEEAADQNTERARRARASLGTHRASVRTAQLATRQLRFEASEHRAGRGDQHGSGEYRMSPISRVRDANGATVLP